MNDIFYYNWLFTKDDRDRYKDEINIVPLSSESQPGTEVGIKPISMPPGFWCRYINPLRNGNCFEQFTLKKDQIYAIEMISDLDVKSLYLCGNMILAGQRGAWSLYDPASHQSIAQGNWKGMGGSFYCFGTNFLINDNILKEYDSSGKLLSNTMMAMPPNMGLNEVARVNNITIIDAYVSPDLFQDQMPKQLRPCGFLQSIKESEFTTPQGKSGMRDIARSSTIAFVEDNVKMPVYLDELIVQPITNGIVLFSYDLIIQRILKGEFKPHFVSAGPDGIIYLAAIKDQKERLLAITKMGRIIFEVEIPFVLGDIVCPPMVSSNNSIYWVGTNGFAIYDNTGEKLATGNFPGGGNRVSNVIPVLYNDLLAVSLGSTIMIFTPSGENIMNVTGFTDNITTPLVTDGNGNYFAGAVNGLFAIKKK